MRAKLLFLAMAGWLYGALAIAGPPGPGHSHANEIRRLQQQEQERRDHIKQQKGENAAFRESLKNMTPEERQAAIAEHRQTQAEDNQAFRLAQHEENLALLKERLASNTKLTDEQKEELINFFEEQYQEAVDFRSAQQAENVAFFTSIANDQSLTLAEKKEAIRAHFEAQRAENKAFRQEQKLENQAERAAITSAVESSSETE